VLKPLKHVQDLLAENAELAARLKLADERTGRLQQEICPGAPGLVVRTDSTGCPGQCEPILTGELRSYEWARALRLLALSVRGVAKGEHGRGTRSTTSVERQLETS